MMEPSLALGRLELNSSSSTVGLNLGPRLSAGPPAKDIKVQVGSQVPSHLNGCVPLSHQVAGHKYGVDKVGILQHPDGTVLKQLQPPPRGPREMQFYCKVYAKDCYDPCLIDLQDHLPKYYGTCSAPDSPNDLYLKLEDVTRRFNKPCIMDVKLGQRSYDPYASQDKREQQIRKYPLMEEIGFLVLGMRVYKVCSDSFETYNQHYGRGLVKDTVKEGLSKFFHNGAGLRLDAVAASVRRVCRILRWFESQRQLVFYASSLLFVYEGLSSSSSSPSPVITPQITPPPGKVTMLAANDAQDMGELTRQEGKEETEGRKEMAEYNNNNNIQASSPWAAYSLTQEYDNQKKIAGLCCHGTKGCLHDNGGVTATAVYTTAPDSTMIGVELQPNGNGTVDPQGVPEGMGPGVGGETVGRGGGGGDPAGEAEMGEVEVRMIDFAHVFPSDSHDRGYIYGLKHLLAVLEEIQNTS